MEDEAKCVAERDRGLCICGGAGGGATTLAGSLADVRRAYEERIAAVLASHRPDKLQLQVSVLKEWVRDLTAQNALLAATVEELETTVTGLVPERRRLTESKVSCDRANALQALNDKLEKDNLKKEREIKRLRRELQEREKTCVQRPPANASAGCTLVVTTSEAQVAAKLCECGPGLASAAPAPELDREAREQQRRVQDLEDKLKAASAVGVRLRESVRALRAACAARDRRWRAAAQHSHFRDLIAHELCRQLRAAKAQKLRHHSVLSETRSRASRWRRRASRYRCSRRRSRRHGRSRSRCRSDSRRRSRSVVCAASVVRWTPCVGGRGGATSPPRSPRALDATDDDVRLIDRSPSPPLLVSDASLDEGSPVLLCRSAASVADLRRSEKHPKRETPSAAEDQLEQQKRPAPANQFELQKRPATELGPQKRPAAEENLKRETKPDKREGEDVKELSTEPVSLGSSADSTRASHAEDQLHTTMQILKNKEETVRVQAESLALAEARIADLSRRLNALARNDRDDRNDRSHRDEPARTRECSTSCCASAADDDTSAHLECECSCGLAEENKRLKLANDSLERETRDLHERVRQLEQSVRDKDSLLHKYEQLAGGKETHDSGAVDALSSQLQLMLGVLNEKSSRLQSAEGKTQRLRERLKKMDSVAKEQNVAVREELSQLTLQVERLRRAGEGAGRTNISAHRNQVESLPDQGSFIDLRREHPCTLGGPCARVQARRQERETDRCTRVRVGRQQRLSEEPCSQCGSDCAIAPPVPPRRFTKKKNICEDQECWCEADCDCSGCCQVGTCAELHGACSHHTRPSRRGHRSASETLERVAASREAVASARERWRRRAATHS
ncbi:uncharacterized protein LOC121739682 [Aricia agestis]|uniref:uncharacterized protein LOC121739682 n=1 Tax=Aricia agestis TaxID=91739 RepID=UPI001C208E67|nr:uncharacterized protein LOC121739682 [Aricia agestis]